MKKRIGLVLMAAIWQSVVLGQELEQGKMKRRSSTISVETDPTAFFFNGFSLVVRRSQTFHENLNLGVGWYQVDLPEFYIESVDTNKAKGWSAVNYGLDLFVDFFLMDPNNGLSLGLHLGYYEYQIERIGHESDYQSIVETFRLGYLWRPLKQFNLFYIYPWAGISTGQKISGSNVVVGEAFKTPKWSFVPSVQIGLSF